MNKIKCVPPVLNGHHWHRTDQKIDYIKWSNTYSLGIKLIDDQHKRLLESVNDFLNFAAENQMEEHARFKEVIAEVVEYIKVHFASEEGIMLATRFPGYEEHKKTHESFILTVIQSVRDYEAGNRLVLINFARFMKNWVFSHIAVMDVQYIDYFKKIIISRSDGSQYMSLQDITSQFSGQSQSPGRRHASFA